MQASGSVAYYLAKASEKAVTGGRARGGAMEHARLSNGVEMPMLGYGVFQIDDEATERCVGDALGRHRISV